MCNQAGGLALKTNPTVSVPRSGQSNGVFDPRPLTEGEVPPDSFFQTAAASHEYPIWGLDALNAALYPF